jgi:MFS family permease
MAAGRSATNSRGALCPIGSRRVMGRELIFSQGCVFCAVVRFNFPGQQSKPAALFFIQWMGLAVWMVPLTLVLNAHGYGRIQPFAFATGALAAFVSPLFFGAMADRHLAPSRVLRWLSLSAAVTLTLVSAAIEWRWNEWVVLGLIQLFSLTATPTVSISSAIALAGMMEPKRQFGPVRAMGTIGWMVGCLLVSALGADTSTAAGFAGAALWLALSGYTWLLPVTPPPAAAVNLTWQERLGLDALALLTHRDHRVIFLATCLLNIPLAAFYPYVPAQLRDLGLDHPAAWMSLAQSTEIVAMFTLGALLARWRLKWVLGAGLALALLRYVAFMSNQTGWVLAGIALHGGVYTLFFTTAQIYVNDRVEAAWRTRAQALLTLMNSGVGYLLGYLGCGWWFKRCGGPDNPDWLPFWGALTVAVALVVVYFLAAYRGIGRGMKPTTKTVSRPSEADICDGVQR